MCCSSSPLLSPPLLLHLQTSPAAFKTHCVKICIQLNTISCLQSFQWDVTEFENGPQKVSFLKGIVEKFVGFIRYSNFSIALLKTGVLPQCANEVEVEERLYVCMALEPLQTGWVGDTTQAWKKLSSQILKGGVRVRVVAKVWLLSFSFSTTTRTVLLVVVVVLAHIHSQYVRYYHDNESPWSSTESSESTVHYSVTLYNVGRAGGQLTIALPLSTLCLSTALPLLPYLAPPKLLCSTTTNREYKTGRSGLRATLWYLISPAQG